MKVRSSFGGRPATRFDTSSALILAHCRSSSCVRTIVTGVEHGNNPMDMVCGVHSNLRSHGTRRA
jgi:hypothetical protein